MKSAIALLALVTVVGLALPGKSLAQQSAPGMMGVQAQSARLYDPQTVETVSGRVLSVERIAWRRGRLYGVHLVLKTASGELSVHLGPSWFIDRQDMKISPGDDIEVTGSRLTYEGKPTLIAARVAKGKKTLVLRDSEGFPLWSRSRSR